MGFLREFREFAMRGNVLDMAVGVIIGGAFGKITSSVVSDLVMPVLGLVTGGIDFSNLFINLSAVSVATLDVARKAGVPVIAYGRFVNVVLDFVFVSFAVFLMVKAVNRFYGGGKPADTPKRVCSYCKMEISDDAVRCPYCTSDLC